MRVIDSSHLVTGERLSSMVDDAVRAIGLTAEMLLADLSQQVLTPMGAVPGGPVRVEGTVPGRAYQLGEILRDTDERGGPLLWVPMMDGADRAGILRIGLDGPADTAGGVADTPQLRRFVWTLGGLMGHIVMTKVPYSDRLRRWRSGGPLIPAAELLWQLVPPRTFATD